MTDEPTEPTAEPEADAEDAPRPYKRRVGITLAVLALLGGWIAVLQTNAATNESRTTREATRLASEAQTARVLSEGIDAALRQIDAEIDTFGERPAFATEDQVGDDLGVTIDPEAQQARLDAAVAELDDAASGRQELATRAAIDAQHLTLLQAAVVQERITWNARASQYETVVTVLAVAIFLIGFTLVVGRRLRPPFALPGLLLAVYCFGWAIWIYQKPIPDVDRTAITRTAEGEVAVAEARPDDAIASFDEAIALDDGYAPPHAGRGTAVMVAANPDVLSTLALTDTDPSVIDDALGSLDRALELDPDDSKTEGLAGFVEMAGADWAAAAERLDQARSSNDLAPRLALYRSAVAVAQGDEELARELLGEVADRFSVLADTETDRALVAQYLSLLEFVADRAPDQADLARSLRDEVVAKVSDLPDTGTDPADVELTIEQLSWADGKTTIDLAIGGIPDGQDIAVVGYERPAPGASFVQPAELFAVGPKTDLGGVQIRSPRACVAVEYRVDVYVDGGLAASQTTPGADPTC